MDTRIPDFGMGIEWFILSRVGSHSELPAANAPHQQPA